MTLLLSLPLKVATPLSRLFFRRHGWRRKGVESQRNPVRPRPRASGQFPAPALTAPDNFWNEPWPRATRAQSRPRQAKVTRRTLRVHRRLILPGTAVGALPAN